MSGPGRATGAFEYLIFGSLTSSLYTLNTRPSSKEFSASASLSHCHLIADVEPNKNRAAYTE